MESTKALLQRSLGMSDIPDLMALVEESGWNQTTDDWQRLLTLGTGLGVTDKAGRVIASAVSMPYDGTLGWIGMVLVAGHWRRRGIATDLVNACIADLESRGLVPGLDATPAGEMVYQKMGFAPGISLTRWRREAQEGLKLPQHETGISDDDIGWITDLDARAFGARRHPLIADLAGIGACQVRANKDKAFLFQRPGRYARYLGPLCSIDNSHAQDLLSQALDDLSDPLVIDVPDHQVGVSEILPASGFLRERPFRRMYLDRQYQYGDPALMYAIAGPELG